jgi:hypothetical protein
MRLQVKNEFKRRLKYSAKHLQPILECPVYGALFELIGSVLHMEIGGSKRIVSIRFRINEYGFFMMSLLKLKLRHPYLQKGKHDRMERELFHRRHETQQYPRISS